MFWRRRKPDPVLLALQALTEKVDKMALDFTSIDADLASLQQEINQVADAVKAGNTAAADNAANVAALAQRDAQIKAMRDQLAAIMAPAPTA
jgi:predicted  nucleic acid-binding Zn-ribbon protein